MLAAFTLTAPWSKGANAITEAETSCLKITCCNMAILPVWSLVPELACLSASSPPSSFESSLTGRKPPSSFKSSLTGRRRRASRRRLADYRGHRRRSRRSVPPSSLLSCDSRVLWHSNGARTLLLIQEFACSSTTRHGSSTVVRLHYQKIGAGPSQHALKVGSNGHGSRYPGPARHRFGRVYTDNFGEPVLCWHGSKWQCKRGIHFRLVPVGYRMIAA